MFVEAKRVRSFTITDWDLFRTLREKRGQSQHSPSHLDRWSEQLKEDVKAATKSIQTDFEVDRMDSRLAHLLEAKKSLLDRWKGQRFNRKLRKKIAELNRTIEEHCEVLSKQQWDELCNSVDGQMRVGGKWNLLKHLLDDTNSKSNQRHVIEKVLHEAKRSEPMGVIADKLANRYLPVGSVRPTDYPTYKGEPNPTLDEPFSTSEVRAVLHNLNGRSAPGPDGISNRALRNLDDDSIEYLTEEINRVWKQGLLPDTWKSASVVVIPKPGKPPGLANL